MDHQTISQNVSNITYTSVDDLRAEMIALKLFVVDQFHMLQKKIDENQFYSIMETKQPK